MEWRARHRPALLHGAVVGAEVDHPLALDGGEVAGHGVGGADPDEHPDALSRGADPDVAEECVDVSLVAALLSSSGSKTSAYPSVAGEGLGRGVEEAGRVAAAAVGCQHGAPTDGGADPTEQQQGPDDDGHDPARRPRRVPVGFVAGAVDGAVTANAGGSEPPMSSRNGGYSSVIRAV